MPKYRFLLLVFSLLVLVMVPLATRSAAQSDDDDTQTFTFPDGPTLTYNAAWSLVASATTANSFMLSRETSFLTTTRFDADALAALDGDDPVLAAMQSLYTFGDGAVLDATTVEVVTVNGAGVLRFAVTDLASTTLLFGAELPSGEVLVLTGLPRGVVGPVENVALQMLASVPLAGGRTPSPDADPFAAEPDPYFADPVGDFADLLAVLGPVPDVLALSDTAFDDGTELRFPLGWEIHSNPDIPDFIEFRVGAGQVFVDVYSRDDLDALQVEDMQDLMAARYIYLENSDFFYDTSDIWTVTFDDLFLYFYRYVDGLPGTQMAIGLPNGSVLMIDAWNVPAESAAETLAFAMLLDAAGAPGLLDLAAGN